MKTVKDTWLLFCAVSFLYGAYAQESIDVASNWNMYLHVALGMLICFFVLGVFLVSAVLISLAVKYAEPRLNSLRSYW